MSNASPMPPAAAPREGGAALSPADPLAGLPAATRDDLERFAALPTEWQRAHNLVARGALADIWSRHVADSLQLLHHAPDFRHWVDLGSGAGFPGLVVAIACKARPACRFTLVEANAKKAAFLRAAIRETGASADVAAERIETHAARSEPADVVSARALAPLPALLELGAPYMGEASVMLLLKGQDFVQERDEASKSWDFDVLDSPSATDSSGRVLAIRKLRPKRQRP